MTAYVTDAKGRRWSLSAPLAWRMEYTAGVPCDSFWMCCPWEKNSPTKCEVSVTVKGRILELSGRGMAARLLDNEALGQDYQSATQADIIRDHVAPYGGEVAPGAVLPPVSHLSVATGSSEWSVVYEFARYYGGVAPRFDRLGRLVLSGWNDSRERVVDDSARLLALLRRDRRYGALSQVLMRDRWSGRVEQVDNAALLACGGMARRVITMPTRSSYKAMRYSGQLQLETSAAELERVEVTLGEPFCAWPGDLVTIQRADWDWNGRYRAAQVSVGMDSGGYWTRIELALPDFVI